MKSVQRDLEKHGKSGETVKKEIREPGKETGACDEEVDAQFVVKDL